MAQITNERDGATFTCESGDTILRAALRAGVGMPYSCNTGSCGNCRFDLVEGSVSHLRDDPPAWSERDLARNRWLGCQAIPGGDCRIKFRTMEQYLPPVRPERAQAELVGIRPVTRDINEFSLRFDRAIDFRPGQYALLDFPGVEGSRAYSMSNLPGEDIWRFMIKRVPEGRGTGWLFEAGPGAEIGIDGPYGTAFLREEIRRDIVLLAGGSGLSPMVSIAEGAVAAGFDRIHLFYGGRQTGDLFRPEDALSPAAREAVTFTAALSDPEPGAEWSGPTGFLHDVVEAQMGEALKACEIYFAGPAVMSAAVQKMAHGLGVPMDQLHFDEFY